jgi:hypothetical protein
VLKGVMQTTLCCDFALKMLTRYGRTHYNFVMLRGRRWTGTVEGYGRSGRDGLLTQYETETGRLCRALRLVASEDGKSALLVGTDECKVGIQREYRFEITTGELIALVRATAPSCPEKIMSTPSTLIERIEPIPRERTLTAAQFQRSVDVPPDAEWFERP